MTSIDRDALLGQLTAQDLNDPTPITDAATADASAVADAAAATATQAQQQPAPQARELSPGQSLRSADGRFEFIYQTDGNLVHYRRSDDKALWASGTHGRPGARCVMQDDGNLVIYDAADAPLWAAGTHGHHGARLAIQDDGNVVIYARDGRPVWSTDTWERR